LSSLKSFLEKQNGKILEVEKISRKLEKKFFMPKKPKLGSSETTREAPLKTQQSPFLFDFYLQPQHKKEIDESFLEWFLGFTEGDGSFSIRKDGSRKRLAFEIFQKDPKLVYKIRSQLGFGTVSSSGYKYSVNDKKGLQRIASLFAGNLVLPKRRSQFQKWFSLGKVLGVWPKTSDFVTLEARLLRENQPELTTAWFSGFLEAEGCFYACVSPSRSPFPCLMQKITLTQHSLVGEKDILKELGRLLESKAQVRLVKKPNTYRLEMASLETHKILINYLQKFPLQGKKGIAFRRWWRVFLQRQEKKHLTAKGIEKLKRLCKEINNHTQKIEEEKEKEEKWEVGDRVH
jgi:hypothetical protein